MKYELHPLCTLFPRLNGAEFEALKEDIKANGLRQPIVIHEGMILDGGNRYRACVEAGVDPEVIEYDDVNIVSFVLSCNLHRRHMTPGQQAAIVASAQDWARAQTRGGDRKADQSRLNDFDTVEKRAAIAGVHRDTQMKADKVAKENPELAKKVAHGEISLPKAVEQISPKKQSENKPDLKIVQQDNPSTLSNDDTDGIADELYGDFDPIAELETANKEIERLTKIVESDDALATAVAENKRLAALVDVLEERMRGYQVSENEAKRAAQSWKNKFDRLERQVKAAGMVDF